MTVMNDLDGFMLRSSGLNTFHSCSREVCYGNLMGLPIEVPFRTFARDFGKTVHHVEESTWNLIMGFPDSTIPLGFLKRCTTDKLRKRLTSIKAHFLYDFHDHLFDAVDRISIIDAMNFMYLKRHFDRNVEQARRYLIPLEMEMSFEDIGIKVKGLVDNVSMIPSEFKEYKNKKDTVLIKDYKPGKLKDGRFSLIDTLRQYGYGTLNRQLNFYLINGMYEIPVETKTGGTEMVPVDAKYCAGVFYKTGQYVVEKKDGRSFAPLKKLISKFWSNDRFPRRERSDFWADHCNFCQFRTYCRKSIRDMKENHPDPILLDDLVKVVTCKKCKKRITILKRVDRKTCYECIVKKDETDR